MTTNTWRHGRAIGDLAFLVTVVIAAIIIAHIVFTLLGANPANDIVSTFTDWAGFFGAWFKDLFTPDSPKLAVFLNFGLAAIFYLAVGGLARRVLNDAFA